MRNADRGAYKNTGWLVYVIGTIMFLSGTILIWCGLKEVLLSHYFRENKKKYLQISYSKMKMLKIRHPNNTHLH